MLVLEKVYGPFNKHAWRVQECDSQLQRALNYENFQVAQDIRSRRTEIDNALSKLKVMLGTFSYSACFQGATYEWVLAEVKNLEFAWSSLHL